MSIWDFCVGDDFSLSGINHVNCVFYQPNKDDDDDDKAISNTNRFTSEFGASKMVHKVSSKWIGNSKKIRHFRTAECKFIW